MVHADSLNPAALISAMESGNFYATSGTLLDEVKFDNNTLSIQIKAEPNVAYTITFIGCRKGETAPVTFHSVQGNAADFSLTDDMLYVRCRITSTKLHVNPIEDLIYGMAWTQPIVNK
jgi:hypothetical protein